MSELVRTIILIIAFAPILFWVGKIGFTLLALKFSTSHEVTFELTDKHGKVIHSRKLDVSADKSFFAAVNKIYQEEKKRV
ncbi:hypothetical protein [Alteromonas sp.]|uniref:hypothetical protein n=1 Tax=Alteromonas sp. TaxID=232 RepID=UPI00257B1368|nr:hypothetical protein [Alteromonas sp.]NQY17172.1 hypothetical protein [Alteromonas sp.]|tara:strand:- start:451 stop:690 length:240 start_codon:yes stop_codon:yes gene_type:complete